MGRSHGRADAAGNPNVVELLVAGPVRRTQGEAYPREWLSQHANSIVMPEHDNEQDGVDILAELKGTVGCFREGN
jgi:hypothetical protein